jgi:hypothetical protein
MLRSLSPVLALAVLTVPAACTVRQTYELPPPEELSTPTTDGGSASSTLPDTGVSCETSSDPENCGVCGHSCGGGACAFGACQPLLLASDTNLQNLVIAEREAYWLNGAGEVRAVSLAGGSVRTLASGWTSVRGENVAGAQNGSHVFFALTPADAASSGIVTRVIRISKTGGDVDVLGSVTSSLAVQSPGVGARAIVVEGDDVFWVSSVQGEPAYKTRQQVARCPVGGCNGAPDMLLEGDEADQLLSLVVRNATVFTANFTLGRIERRLPDGGTDRFLSVPLPEAIAADSKHLYVQTKQPAGYGSNVVRCDWPPTEVLGSGCMALTTLASGGRVDVSPAAGLAIDAEHVVWSNIEWGASPVRDSIMRCPKEGLGCGANPEVLVELGTDSLGRPRLLAMDAKAVYWSNARGELFKLAKPASSALPTTQ